MDLSENVVLIERADRQFYLVGTAHVSRESVQEVVDVLEMLKPDTVCVELCPTRFESLTEDKAWQRLDIFKVIREGKTLFLLASLALTAYQRRLGNQLGVRPGAEMLAATRKAQELGAEVVLIDRDVRITLKRTWRSISLWHKLGLLSAVFSGVFTKQQISEDQIEQLKQQAHLSQLMQDFARMMPDVKGPLIDERDQYMAASMKQAAGSRVVAIVGAGHVEGMRQRFDEPVDLDQLRRVPPVSGWTSLLKWIIPFAILGAFAFGYLKNRGKTLAQMIYAWVLPNSIAAAILTAVAGAKWLSVLTALVSSPITSLNPLLGAGMVVGLVEAWLRKPTVQDAERVSQDVESLAGVYRNPFTRVLLVAVMSTLGSALGAWIGATWVIALLAR